MPAMTLDDLSDAMKDIDFTMMVTRGDDTMTGRPMSNNRQVDYDGDSWYFSYDDSRKVADISRDPDVTLVFQGNKGLFGKPPLFISVSGTAELVRDRAAFADHWSPDLERWFEQGIDTPGLVLIKVSADAISYWDGEESGTLRP